MPAQALSSRFISRAEKLGFTPPFIVNIDNVSDQPAEHLRAFLDLQYHGSMTWMEETYERRSHPKKLWPACRSAVIFGFNYGPATDPLESLQQKAQGTISVYARNRDYHDVMKGRLKELAGLLARDTDQEVKVFVDTAPLMEKPLAALAGLGWQGKHTHLISRDYGSWLFLGVILSQAELQSTPAEIDHCGSCRACLDICPTQAFPAPYQLDARRCISYLTIEHKGPVDPTLRPLLGNHIYGCDDCLAVCPWNKFAQIGKESKLQARQNLNAPPLAELSALTDTMFKAQFSGSPIRRIGRDQFIRNVLYAIGNSGLKRLIPYLKPHLNATSPVLVDAARWALKRLG